MNVKIDNETLVFFEEERKREEEFFKKYSFLFLIYERIRNAKGEKEREYWLSLKEQAETISPEFAEETFKEDLNMNGGMFEWN